MPPGSIHELFCGREQWAEFRLIVRS